MSEDALPFKIRKSWENGRGGGGEREKWKEKKERKKEEEEGGREEGAREEDENMHLTHMDLTLTTLNVLLEFIHSLNPSSLLDILTSFNTFC